MLSAVPSKRAKTSDRSGRGPLAHAQELNPKKVAQLEHPGAAPTVLTPPKDIQYHAHVCVRVCMPSIWMSATPPHHHRWSVRMRWGLVADVGSILLQMLGHFFFC